MTRIRAIAARHSRRVWLLWLIGAAVLLAGSLAIADPAIVALVIDPELVALLVGTAAGMLRFRFSEALNARRNRRNLGRHRKALKIVSADYYDWHDLPPPIDLGQPKDYWGLHTGFLRINSTFKPALTAVRQAARAIR